jgi:16S rRNA (cytosine967-C5)-methyltransferase
VPTPARRLAFQILAEIDRGGATLADRLAAPEAAGLPRRERAFLHELVLGTLRRRGELDHTLAALVDRPLGRLDPGALVALRLGAYQILHLRVPDRAAVSESVDLVRHAAPRAAGFVNAVLRRLAREGRRQAPDPVSDPVGWLTTAGSLPRWLAERWTAELGAAAAVARARALAEPPAIGYRLNPRADPERLRARIEEAGLAPRPLIVPGAWAATEGSAAALAEEGLLYLQDEGSQLVAHLAARPGALLDACAAPGGKSTLMADLVGGSGHVVAAEASPRRLRTLATLVARWGSPNVRVVGADALRPPFRGRFDAVLVDAPCSGLGTLGRHPDIRWRSRPEELPRHAERQRQILEAVTPLVAPGGRLVYSVCSPEPEETEGVVAPFLADHPELTVEIPPAWAAPFAEGASLRTRAESGGDEFFAAILRKA